MAGSTSPLAVAGQVDQVFPPTFVTLLVLVMGDQRVGGDADDLVEQIEGEQVVGKGAADGAEQRQGEAGVETRLGVLARGRACSRWNRGP